MPFALALPGAVCAELDRKFPEAAVPPDPALTAPLREQVLLQGVQMPLDGAGRDAEEFCQHRRRRWMLGAQRCEVLGPFRSEAGPTERVLANQRRPCDAS